MRDGEHAIPLGEIREELDRRGFTDPERRAEITEACLVLEREYRAQVNEAARRAANGG